MNISKRVTWGVIFTLFLFMNGMFLHRIPGLLGDEGSEGENVYQLLHADHITVIGERSYIGPWIDYVRVPFVWVFGYSTLTLRIPIFIVSILLFWVLASVLRRLFGDEVAMWGVIFLTFSPVYVSYQRLGWAITLLPFFALLIVWLVQRNQKLLSGLAAGIGLSTHIMFLPTLIALVCMGLLGSMKTQFRQVLSWWPAVVGFWAGFAMQFVVLILMREDQGEPLEVAKLFSERLFGLKDLLPLLVSGSSYVAAYTGVAMSSGWIWSVVGVISILALSSFLLPRKGKIVLGMWVGLLVQILVLSYMIDRYTLRYFVVPVVWIWLLSGMGMAALLQRTRISSDIQRLLGCLVAFFLSIGVLCALFVPFLKTGGSLENVSLSNRNESASALVDVRPVLSCLSGKQNIFSENVHILNRLQYLSHSNSSFGVLLEEEKDKAEYIVNYRTKENEASFGSGVCPEVHNFQVLPK